MNISSIKGVKLEAISACVPQKVVDNHSFARENFQEDMESVIAALGIEERHICRLETTTSLDLCVHAASQIIKDGFDVNDIGALVFVTLTPDYLMPNNASYAQHLLGLPQEIPAFDINHACSGYIYGLWNAALIAQNMGKKVLLLDGDVNSHYVSRLDKATGLLFGDAGSASIISPSNENNVWNFTFITDGTNRDAIVMKLGFRNPVKKEFLDYNELADGSKRRFIDMAMDGESVFRYVVNLVPKMVESFFNELELHHSEFDLFIPHQANSFMLRKLARKIGFDIEKMPISMKKYGNTSSVSIPLTICSELSNMNDANVLLTGMGAGLATGIAKIDFNSLNNLGVVQVDL